MLECVFILSAQRSGSTLLRIILDRFPELVGVPESFFWRFKDDHKNSDLSKIDERRAVAESLSKYYKIRTWDLDHHVLKERIVSEGTSWRKIFELLIDQYFCDSEIDPHSPCRYWCEKSPPHIFRQNSILADFPEAKFVYLVRDPRDQAASAKQVPWNTSNVHTIARVWRKSVRTIELRNNTMLLRYEDLVGDPETSVKQLCEFLEISYSTEFVHGASEFSKAKFGSQNPEIHEKAAQKITDASVGTWKKRLSRPDQDFKIIQMVCKKEMQRFGYERVPFKRDLKFFLYYFYKWSGTLLNRVLAIF